MTVKIILQLNNINNFTESRHLAKNLIMKRILIKSLTSLLRRGNDLLLILMNLNNFIIFNIKEEIYYKRKPRTIYYMYLFFG
jgi:hypothetical protein